MTFPLLELAAQLPHQGRSAHAKQASYQGAKAAQGTRGRKSQLMLRVLYPNARLTDPGIHAAMLQEMPVRPSSVQSIRAGLIACGLVEDSGQTEQSHFTSKRVQVVQWQLTEAGRAAVQVMREER